jgi:hypothetical protein
MKKCAIIVEHLAWLYAEIIRQVMIQGLERMRTTTQLSGNHDANPVPSASSGSGQPLMLQDDSSMTSVVSAEVRISDSDLTSTKRGTRFDFSRLIIPFAEDLKVWRVSNDPVLAVLHGLGSGSHEVLNPRTRRRVVAFSQGGSNRK